MFTLLDKEVVVFDLETTDTGVAEAAGVLPSIVEIGAVRMSSEFEILDKYESLVQPSRLEAFTDFCHKLTGIKLEELRRARPWAQVWREFAEFTRFNATRLIAWHAAFDTPVLRAAYLRDRLGFPHNQSPVCAMSMVYYFCAEWGINTGGWGLKKVCDRFGVVIKDQHRALGDAVATAELLRAVAKFPDKLEK